MIFVRRPKRFGKRRGREEFKRLCARFIAKTDDGDACSVMVTGCNAREGASSVALNLAETCADEIGDGVLLVESNMRSPILAKSLKLKPVPGLSDLIDGSVEQEDVVHRPKNSFGVILAGKPVVQPATLLNSDRIMTIMAELKKSFRLIILDSPPVMAYSDALFLAPKVDQVLLVVRGEKTRWEVAQQAVQKLNEVEAPLCGTVLNGKKFYIPKLIYDRL